MNRVGLAMAVAGATVATAQSASAAELWCLDNTSGTPQVVVKNGEKVADQLRETIYKLRTKLDFIESELKVGYENHADLERQLSNLLTHTGFEVPGDPACW